MKADCALRFWVRLARAMPSSWMIPLRTLSTMVGEPVAMNQSLSPTWIALPGSSRFGGG